MKLRIYYAKMFWLGYAIYHLSHAYIDLQNAVSRCRNCGKVMDSAVCPFCGFVQ